MSLLHQVPKQGHNDSSKGQRATGTSGNHCTSQHCDNANNNNLIFNPNSEFKMNTTRAH